LKAGEGVERTGECSRVGGEGAGGFGR